MNEGHPAEGNEGLFSGFFKKFGRGKREEDVTEEIWIWSMKAMNREL